MVSRESGEHAPLAAFIITPHSSLRICAGLRRRAFEQPWSSPARRNDSFGGRVYPGKIRRVAVATHGGGNGGLFPGRLLFLLGGAAVGPWQSGKDSLAPSHAGKAKVA